MPLNETLTKFNWIDIVVAALVLIMSYRGFKKGFIVEMFKLSGIVLSIYVSLHYFSRASDFLYQRFPIIKLINWDFICFTILAVMSYLAMAAARNIFCRFVKVEAASGLNKWGGLAAGFFRGSLTASMLFLLFYFSTVAYLKESVKKSYLGSQCVVSDVKVYEFIFNNIVLKFSPGDKLNQGIYEVLEE
ncbi:MAG: hypothetical protein A3G37_02170 [Omnitrophica WOR_2 bacterium RIFCSPLOWO2_12_FULL_46_30]|nr:MAG: hypothetical protein A3D27_01000 [Omnitrophica WOR_2 bacterium RIFCSPHIGHO2_02_FULL_46_37]OGX43155.1 MAG: hypothetical protein A3H41_01030 [Omnitrophica WOR_2 bacterium RIFCSPLOWO2_02_FULL_45_28]OGX51822.1 MAG: hypothetical protein A3G37_02170 [Omnitrophica WOR_2 bacterium RIFCSPLOWO2_12_FULL_46_30]